MLRLRLSLLSILTQFKHLKAKDRKLETTALYSIDALNDAIKAHLLRDDDMAAAGHPLMYGTHINVCVCKEGVKIDLNPVHGMPASLKVRHTLISLFSSPLSISLYHSVAASRMSSFTQHSRPSC